jgi:hypothetical protein
MLRISENDVSLRVEFSSFFLSFSTGFSPEFLLLNLQMLSPCCNPSTVHKQYHIFSLLLRHFLWLPLCQSPALSSSRCYYRSLCCPPHRTSLTPLLPVPGPQDPTPALSSHHFDCDGDSRSTTSLPSESYSRAVPLSCPPTAIPTPRHLTVKQNKKNATIISHPNDGSDISIR